MTSANQGWWFAAYLLLAVGAFTAPNLELNWLGWVAVGMMLECALTATAR